MRSPRAAVLAALLAAVPALTGGCELVGRGAVRHAELEPLLAAAGFQAVPADTDARRQRLEALPALRLTSSTRGGHVHYWLADPEGCRCLYTGGQVQYARLEAALDGRGTRVRPVALPEEVAVTYDHEMDHWLPSGEVMWPGRPGGDTAGGGS